MCRCHPKLPGTLSNFHLKHQHQSISTSWIKFEWYLSPPKIVESASGPTQCLIRRTEIKEILISKLWSKKFYFTQVFGLSLKVNLPENPPWDCYHPNYDSCHHHNIGHHLKNLCLVTKKKIILFELFKIWINSVCPQIRAWAEIITSFLFELCNIWNDQWPYIPIYDNILFELGNNRYDQATKFSTASSWRTKKGSKQTNKQTKTKKHQQTHKKRNATKNKPCIQIRNSSQFHCCSTVACSWTTASTWPENMKLWSVISEKI